MIRNHQALSWVFQASLVMYGRSLFKAFNLEAAVLQSFTNIWSLTKKILQRFVSFLVKLKYFFAKDIGKILI